MFSAENLLKDSFFVVIVQIYLFINIIHTKTPNLIGGQVVHFCLTTYTTKTLAPEGGLNHSKVVIRRTKIREYGKR